MSLDPVTAALNIGGKLIDRFFPDQAQADAAKLELLKLQQSGELAQLTGQLEINKAEAATGSLFIGGWRPGSGWICNIGLAYTFIVQPLCAWVASIKGWPVPPAIDTDTLIFLLCSLLGIGGLRSMEKIKGVASK